METISVHIRYKFLSSGAWISILGSVGDFYPGRNDLNAKSMDVSVSFIRLFTHFQSLIG